MLPTPPPINKQTIGILSYSWLNDLGSFSFRPPPTPPDLLLLLFSFVKKFNTFTSYKYPSDKKYLTESKVYFVMNAKSLRLNEADDEDDLFSVVCCMLSDVPIGRFDLRQSNGFCKRFSRATLNLSSFMCILLSSTKIK